MKPKSTPFTVIVDNREQHPYTFTDMPLDKGRPWNVQIKTRYLPTGDYSLQGWESSVSVERKSLGDLYSTLGQGRERFEREFKRLAEMKHAAIVIEASWEDILNPEACREEWRSKLHPRSVFETLTSWEARYGVHIHAMGSRRVAELKTFAILRHAARHLAEKLTKLIG